MISNYYAYKFIRLLTQKWTDTEAYELGFIDEDGKSTGKKPVSSDDKGAYNRFTKLVFNIKRMLDKVPFGKTTIGRYTAALALLKEEFGIENIDSLFEDNILTEDQKEIISEITSIQLDESNTHMFGLYFDNDLLIENFCAGFDGIDGSIGTRKRKQEEQADCNFAGVDVFDCDMETFNNCRLGKKKFLKYSTYVGTDEAGEKIRQYSLKNPKKSVILRNKNTGAMLYMRKV